MSNRELIEETIAAVAAEQGLRVVRPYGDAYAQLYDGEKLLGGISYAGFTLAHSIVELAKIVEDRA